MDAYLDIETSFKKDITIVGVYREDKGVQQLIDKDISAENVLNLLERVETIFTYNGDRFDLPILSAKIGVSLSRAYKSRDLMYDCWKRKLYGGLKRVERTLGIKRVLDTVDGYKAMELWEKYLWLKDEDSLRILLKYNEEDIVNLFILKKKLGEL